MKVKLGGEQIRMGGLELARSKVEITLMPRSWGADTNHWWPTEAEVEAKEKAGVMNRRSLFDFKRDYDPSLITDRLHKHIVDLLRSEPDWLFCEEKDGEVGGD